MPPHTSRIAEAIWSLKPDGKLAPLDKGSGNPGSSEPQFWEQRPKNNLLLYLCFPPTSSHLQPAGQGHPPAAH